MSKLNFDSQGKFIGISGKLFDRTNRFKPTPLKHLLGKKHSCQICGRPINHRGNCFSCNIQNKKAEELSMRDLLGNKVKSSEENEELKIYSSQKFDNSQDTKYWSLYKENQKLPPLRFSNNKTQEDVVEEVVNLIRTGTKIIFLHGVCGTGKCLDGDSLIFCKPKGEKYFSYHKISDIVGKEGRILSLNAFGDIIESDFKNVRKTGRKKLYKLKTRTGRDINLSLNHPLLTITEKGVEWKPLKELNSKSYICLPNKIPIKSSADIDDNAIKVLAHLIAEGKLGDKAGSPKYFQGPIKNPNIRRDYIDSLRSLFPDGAIKEKNEEVTITFGIMDTTKGTTNKLRLLLKRYGLDGKRSSQKFVPSEIFGLDNQKVALFLSRLFSCDGSIYCKNLNKGGQITIEYSSISKRLIKDISILLQRFGIQHTIASRKFRENKEYSFRISISGSNNLIRYIEEIGFIGRKDIFAKECLNKLKCHKFTNIDKIPRIIRNYLKNKGYTYNELDRFLNYEEIEKLRKIIGFKKIRKDKLVKTPCVFKQGKIDFLREHLKKVNQYLNDKTLSLICNGDIFWDKIKSIEYRGEDETYDLEVPEHHNFIADGIIVHNSAIALNIARVLGKAAVVVPVKGLQRQYQEDYMGKMFLLKPNKEKLRISMITGRANHDSVFMPGISCADPFLPDTIQIIEKNFKIIKEYYEKNPLIQHKNTLTNLNQLKRISIAPINPYWSPIIPSKYNMNLPDAKMKSYKGLRDTDFIFYHRKEGCSYYDQYDAYLDSDVIIFNAAKYKIETALDRKPETEIDIIDEADEFLDSFSSQSELNLDRLKNSLANLYSEHNDTMDLIDEIIKLIKLEEKNKRATGIDENKIFHIKDTNIRRILSLMLKDGNIESETYSDDSASNYVSKVLEIARQFEDFFDDTYLTYREYEKNLYVNLVTTNLSKRLQEVLDKNKAFVFMSGTLHSKTVLEKVFGITNYKTVEAETIFPGTIEIHQTGKEFDCKYSNFNSEHITKEDYFRVLSDCIEKATRPTLVHVNAFNDLPNEEEINKFSLKGLRSREKLIELQKSDRTGRLISEFKKKLSNILYSTKCSRGVDFPGDSCCSVLFTKYPNPNPQNTFWKILKKTHPQYFWEFYKDKARREFLQRLYRALRSQKDHVFILSPDSRVLEAVRNLQSINKDATSLDTV